MVFALFERASLGGKETYLRRKRCSRASCAATRPSFYTCTCCNVSFSWSSFVSRDDFDAHEVKETRSFFRLSFSQRFRLCSTKIIPKEEIFSFARERAFGVRVSVLVARRVTEIYSSSSCARFTRARSTKVVQVNKEYVRSCVGLLNGMIKIKGTEESQKFSPPYRFAKKKRLGLHFLNIFSFDFLSACFISMSSTFTPASLLLLLLLLLLLSVFYYSLSFKPFSSLLGFSSCFPVSTFLSFPGEGEGNDRRHAFIPFPRSVK